MKRQDNPKSREEARLKRDEAEMIRRQKESPENMPQGSAYENLGSIHDKPVKKKR